MYYPKIRVKNKVPILSKEEINCHAERFLYDFDSNCFEDIHALDIEAFLEFYIKVDIGYDDLSCNNSCLGMAVFNNTDKIPVYDKESNRAKYISAKEGTIIVDNSLLNDGQEKRLRFTLGHEAGHWIFHKEFFRCFPGQMSLFETDTPYIRCRSVNNNYIYRRIENWGDEEWMEWQADKFSACLLMPETSVRKSLIDFHIVEDINVFGEMVNMISAVFNVSKQAAFFRLCELKYIPTNDKQQINYQLSLFD